MFVVIEGGDACGKATQARMLLENLSNPSMLESFPRYETPLGKIILAMLKRGPSTLSEFAPPEHNLVLQTLLNSDRMLFQQGLKPYEFQRQIGDRANERFLICDRWWQSGFVYGRASGLEAEQTYQWIPMHKQAHLNLLIDVPAEVAMERRAPRDKFEEKLSFRRQIRTEYLNLWEERKMGGVPYDYGAWIVIDGTQPAQVVHRIIMDAVLAAFHMGPETKI